MVIIVARRSYYGAGLQRDYQVTPVFCGSFLYLGKEELFSQSELTLFSGFYDIILLNCKRKSSHRVGVKKHQDYEKDNNGTI
jgi:hypothetical protein